MSAFKVFSSVYVVNQPGQPPVVFLARNDNVFTVERMNYDSDSPFVVYQTHAFDGGEQFRNSRRRATRVYVFGTADSIGPASQITIEVDGKTETYPLYLEQSFENWIFFQEPQCLYGRVSSVTLFVDKPVNLSCTDMQLQWTVIG